MKRFVPSLLTFVLASCVATPPPELENAADSAARDASSRPITIGEHEFFRRELTNGLRAVAVRDESPGVSVFMVIGAGRRNETEGTSGVAHLTEHALYTGTENTAAGEHDRRVQSWGGESNAFTRDDYTLFYDHQIPREHLDAALAMEADRLRSISFDRDALLLERERLRVEEEKSYQPSMAREELLEASVYRRHPYRVGVLDENGHTAAPWLSTEVVRSFYDRYYWPDNTAVVVAGNVDPNAALDAIERAFGALERGPRRPAPATEPPVVGARVHEFASDLTRDRYEFVWLVPEMGHPDRPALQILARWISRQRTDDDEPFSANMRDRVDQELFRVAATGPNARDQIEKLLATIANDADFNDLEEIKKMTADDYLNMSLRGRPYLSLAGTFGVYEALGQIESLTQHETRLSMVTAADLQRIAREYLKPQQRVMVVFRGGGTETPATLPDDPQELRALAEAAEQSGDLDRALEVYTKLLETNPSKMYTVIYLASRGQIYMDREDYDGAIEDFETALALVDYPAVRDLLDEAKSRQQTASATGATTATDTARTEPTGTKPSKDEVEIENDLMTRLEEARDALAEWRGLEFLHETSPEFVDPDPERESVAGWYEPDQGRLVVVRGRNARFTQGTLYHELFHALQDQHFNLSRLHREAQGADAGRALTGLIEGEAMFAVSELMDYDFEQHAEFPESGEVDRERFEKMFQYGAGLRFVRHLRDLGGWEAVTQAFRNPPRTTAEIYHPERYPAALALFFWALPEDAGKVVTDEAWGEFELRWLLARQDPALMESLAHELRADRFRAVENDAGEPAEYWDLRFSSPAAAERFITDASEVIARDGWAPQQNGTDVRLFRNR